MEHHHPTEEGGEEMPKQPQREGAPSQVRPMASAAASMCSQLFCTGGQRSVVSRPSLERATEDSAATLPLGAAQTPWSSDHMWLQLGGAGGLLRKGFPASPAGIRDPSQSCCFDALGKGVVSSGSRQPKGQKACGPMSLPRLSSFTKAGCPPMPQPLLPLSSLFSSTP